MLKLGYQLILKHICFFLAKSLFKKKILFLIKIKIYIFF